jgi:hypothetical protein
VRENRAKFHYDQRKCDPKSENFLRRCAAPHGSAAPREKSDFSMGRRAISRRRHFFAIFLVGGSFYVILMKVHARTGPVAVAGFEKKMNKVPCFLQQVSL